MIQSIIQVIIDKNPSIHAIETCGNGRVKNQEVHHYDSADLRPKLTDNPNEPDFFAPIEEWEVFFKTLNINERREFYSTLEMMIETIRSIRLEKNLVSRNRKNSLSRFCLGNVCDWN
ncbi:MAG TPA: hypothetical protein VH796_00055 [Nitrososphaeraceae archaeon]